MDLRKKQATTSDAPSQLDDAQSSGELMSVFSADDLTERIQIWQAYALDPDNNPCISRTPGKRGHLNPDGSKNCDVDDSVLFNALLCASGNTFARDAVAKSQDRNGQWWRSPMHVDDNGNPTNYQGGSSSSFSKDHTLGVLLYLVTTSDIEKARAQAKAWIHFMQKNGRLGPKLAGKLRIGPDIPEPLAEQAAKSLARCADGLMANGCVVYQTVERVEWVWDKVRDAVECVANPAQCWQKVSKKAQVDVPAEIGYWTNDVCTQGDASTCTLTPSTWFLFHRVWRDHLGLAPTANMQFADSLFGSDEGYDEFVAYEANGNSGFQLHLNAVDAFVRALLGKPVSLTVNAVYKKHPDNPFFQYLMFRFVNNNIGSLPDIRDRLLTIAPSKITKKKDNGNVQFLDEANRPIVGNQWAWERDDVAAAVRDTMGWDCIFLANLIVREYQSDLDDYLSHVFPQVIADCTSALSKSLVTLTATLQPVQAAVSKLQDYVDQTAAIIAYDRVTFDQLQALNDQILQKYQATCPFQLQTLYNDYQVARDAYARLLTLRDEVRRKFQDATRIGDFGQFWDQQVAPFSGTADLLNQARSYLDGNTPCTKLVGLLVAIPLRVEQAKISGTNQSLQAVSDQTLADLKAVAKDREIERAKTQLIGEASSLAGQLQKERLRRRYANASALANQIEEAFQFYYGWVQTTVSLLNADELEAIRQDAATVVTQEKSLWDSFVEQFGPAAIVSSRLNLLNDQVQRLFSQLEYLPLAATRVLYSFWTQRAIQAGYVPPPTWSDPAAYQHLDCWQFTAPLGVETDEQWELFDLVLNGLETTIGNLAAIVPPRTAVPRHRVQEFVSLPATGVLFDVDSPGTCQEQVHVSNPPGAVRFTNCTIPTRRQYQAASVSDSGGNQVIESLPFFNRLVIITEGDSLTPGSVSWQINGQRGEQALQVGGRLDVTVPVPYHGAVLDVWTNQLDALNYFTPGTRVEIQTNYYFPDPDALRVYATAIGRLARVLSRIQADLAPGSQQAKVVAALEEGIDVLGIVSDATYLDPITKAQVDGAVKRMLDGKKAITQACADGGSSDLCTAQIREVSKGLATQLETAMGELTTVRQFIQAEVQRLQSISEDDSQRLKAILDNLVQPGEMRGLPRHLTSFVSLQVPQLFADEDNQLIRGVRIVHEFSGLDGLLQSAPCLDRLSIIQSPLDPNGEFVCGNGGCGSILYQGVQPDQGNLGRSAGPVLTNDNCLDLSKMFTGVAFRRSIVMGQRLQQWRAANRPVIIDIVLEYSIKAGQGSLVPQIPNDKMGVFAVIKVYFAENPRSSIYHIADYLHSDVYEDTSWRPGTIYLSTTVTNWQDYPISGTNEESFIISLQLKGSAVQLNRLTWQLVNPF